MKVAAAMNTTELCITFNRDCTSIAFCNREAQHDGRLHSPSRGSCKAEKTLKVPFCSSLAKRLRPVSTLPAREAAMEIAPEVVSGQCLEHNLEANLRRIASTFLHGQE